MRNEEKYIGKCLDGFLNQSYLSTKFNIYVVDGLSDDRSVEIVKSFQLKYNNIYLISNNRRITPVAFNIGIKSSKDDIVGIFSSHSIPSTDYIDSAIKTLIKTDADCVGGPMTAISDSQIGKAISCASSTPFGMGASIFHYSKRPQYANTVYQGFFKREVFEKVGYFDEDLVRNQDDEMSYRIRKNGYKIYYDPKIKSVYYNRSSLMKLFKQYFQYGLYKPLVFKKLKYGMQIHHFIPACFLTYLLSLIVFPNFTAYLLPLLFYFLLCIYFGIKSKSDFVTRLVTIIVYPILHISYGLGFLIGIPKAFFKKHE